MKLWVAASPALGGVAYRNETTMIARAAASEANRRDLTESRKEATAGGMIFRKGIGMASGRAAC